MRHVFILNSFSLKNKKDEIKEKIEKAATKLNLDYKIEINDETVSTEDILNKYNNTKNIIIAVGGDGIINRVLNKIVDTKNILGFIPIGTGNDFYKTCKEQLKNKQEKIDLVKINNKYFINVACFGIDADIGNNENIIHSKLIPKSQRYNAGILVNFLKYKPRRFKVIVDNLKEEKDYMTIAVCNASYYGGGHKIGYSSIVNDHKLDLYLIDKISKIKMAMLILGMSKGCHEKEKCTKIIKTDKIRIESKNKIKSNIDGEVLEAKKFNIELIKDGIEIYYNQELIDMIIS